MEERLRDWHPDRISDRKLLELQNRLDKVRRFGDAFADISLSQPLIDRLHALKPQRDPHAHPEVHAVTDRPPLPAR